MANIFIKDPVYISIDDVRDSTSKPAIVALTNDEIKVLITKAQREIDTYLCRTYRPPVDTDQDYIFPVLKDEVSWLPEEITEAALYVVEQVYSEGDTISPGVWLNIKKETLGPRSYEYEDKATNGLLIPDVALKLLEQFKNRFIWQKLGK